MAAAFLACACANNNNCYDVAIIGGGSSGISAGVSAARCGARTVIVEEGPWLGGMLTSAGVCGIDGNYHLRGGFFREFCDSIATRYGGYDKLLSGWVANVIFEPKVGAEVFANIARKQEGLEVRYNTRLAGVRKRGGIWHLSIEDGNSRKTSIRAKVLVDGTELGDVAAAVGVPYRIGMDSREDSGESIAPEKANDIIQDLTYAVILKDFGPDADMTLPRPATYDSTAFRNAVQWRLNAPELTNRVIWPADYMIIYARIPTYDQFMINWPIDGNDYYLNLIEASPQERVRELEKAKEFTRCFIYFIQTELGMKNLGIDMDQFPTDDGFPLIPYHRESRRIVGEVFFTMDYAGKPFAQEFPLYRTGIAVGDYAVDHHHARYPHYEDLPDLHFYPIPSYNVPMGALIPKAVDDMLVIEKSISVSNIMNGASRVQPVTMQIGQAGGIIAAMAAREGIEPRDVPVRRVQQALLDAGGYIMPYIDTKPDMEHFAQYQRIGATGILKGDPRNVGWANQTWFSPDEDLTAEELAEGFGQWYGIGELGVKGDKVTYADVMRLVGEPSSPDSSKGRSADPSAIITRGEFAIIVDSLLHPFDTDVDLHGSRYGDCAEFRHLP